MVSIKMLRRRDIRFLSVLNVFQSMFMLDSSEIGFRSLTFIGMCWDSLTQVHTDFDFQDYKTTTIKIVTNDGVM